MFDERFGDVSATVDDSYVATVEIHRAPNNFFETDVIESLGDAYAVLDELTECRAILLCSEGKHFCAGANLSASATDGRSVGPDLLYREAARLFAVKTPVVAAIQGAAIGAGFSLACLADFRIVCPEARFSANFARFGFHHILGLTVTLPAIVGQQHALHLLFTGRRVKGDEAFAMGLSDGLFPQDTLRAEAHALAAEIASSAPLALRSIRSTMRAGMVERFRVAAEHEAIEQEWLQSTSDWTEGVRAASEGRPPQFKAQ